MAFEEGWVGIADVGAHLSVAKDSIYRWADIKDFPTQGGTAPALPALGSKCMGRSRRRE